MSITKQKRGIAAALVCISSLIPFINIFPSFSIQTIIVFVAAVYLLIPTFNTKYGIQKKIVGIIFFFFLWVILSLDGFSVEKVSYYVLLFTYMIMVISAARGRGFICHTEGLILFTGIISAGATLLFWINGNIYSQYVNSAFDNKTGTSLINDYNIGNMAGLYSHYSKNGMVLAIAFGLLFCWWLYGKREKHRNLVTVALLMVIVAFLFCGKRGPVIFAIFDALLCYRLYLGKRIGLNKILKSIFLICTIIVAFLIASSFVPQLARVIQRFYESMGTGNVMMGRDTLYMTAYNLFLRNPLFGNGWFSFEALSGVLVGGAHNVYLQLLCEKGIVGLIVFCTFFISMIVATIIEFRKVQEANFVNINKVKMQLLFSIFTQIFFILYGFSGNPLYDHIMLCPYFIALCIYVYYKFNPLSEVNKIEKKY